MMRYYIFLIIYGLILGSSQRPEGKTENAERSINSPKNNTDIKLINGTETNAELPVDKQVDVKIINSTSENRQEINETATNGNNSTNASVDGSVGTLIEEKSNREPALNSSVAITSNQASNNTMETNETTSTDAGENGMGDVICQMLLTFVDLFGPDSTTKNQLDCNNNSIADVINTAVNCTKSLKDGNETVKPPQNSTNTTKNTVADGAKEETSLINITQFILQYLSEIVSCSLALIDGEKLAELPEELFGVLQNLQDKNTS